MHLYHYTDRESAEKIRADGVLKATTKTLFKDMMAQGESLETPPHVWLSINPVLDLTILAKMQLAGLSLEDMARVVLPGEFCDVGLGDYTEAKEIDHEWWNWVVVTGKAAGSDYTTWRLHDQDIPSSAWVGIELFDGFQPDGLTKWKAL